MPGRQISIEIVGDAKSLEAALGKAQTKTSRFGGVLKHAAVGGAIALGGLGIAAKIGFDELNQGARASAQTTAALKSTGGAANVTAGHIKNLANALLQKSGVDDEAIQSGENLLLTFRNIRNETGKGNDIFDQATKATLDLSVAMGQDLHSSAILVGKALNDPVRGMTALRRVGVSLSDNQEKLVKHLVNTGHTMRAQKIILGELKKEFGGSAEAAGKTLPGQLSILRENLKNTAADLTQALLPAFQSLLGVLQSVAGWMQKNQTATKILIGAVAGLSAGVIILNAVYKAWAAITPILTAAQWALNAALEGNPIVLVTTAVIALGVALVIAYKKSETFRNIVNGAFSAVKHAAAAVSDFIRGPVVGAFTRIKNAAGAAIGFIRNHWQALLVFLGGPIGAVIVGVINHWDKLRSAVATAVGRIKSLAEGMADKIRSVANAAAGPLGRIAGFFQNIIDKVSQLIGWISRIHFPDIPSPGSGVPFVPGIAGGTSNFRGGLALVGERGPELVTLPRGSHVTPNHRLRAASLAGGGGPMVVQVVLDRKVIAQAIVREDKDHRRNSGRGLFDN